MAQETNNLTGPSGHEDPRGLSQNQARILDRENQNSADEEPNREYIIQKITNIITSTLNIDEVYEKFAAELKKLVDFDRVTISVVDLEASTKTLKYIFGLTSSDRPPGTVTPLDNSQTQHVVTTRQTLMGEDTTANPEFTSDLFETRVKLRSSIKTPLISKGRIIGVLGLRSQKA